MLINRIPLYFIAITCALTVFGLFYIKDKVVTLRAELQEVKKQIDSEQDMIHLLKAELAYLTSPIRLRELADNYLDLEVTEVTQMSGDPVNDQREHIDVKLVDTEIAVNKVKWRYRKGPSKYVTKVSHSR